MRIGIDCRYIREVPRGVGHYLINVLEQFAINNEELSKDLFYLYSPGPLVYQPPKEKFVMRTDSLPIPGTIWFYTKGKKLITSDSLDIFWAPCDVLPLGLPKKLRKVLSILDLTHLYFPHTMANYNLLIHKLLFLPSLKFADHIITISNFIKQDLIEHFQISSKKITTIYLGVDEKFRRYEKSQVSTVLNRYSISKPYILSVGTLEPKKNYQLLLKTFKSLKTDWDLVIIGKKGWKANDIFKTIDALGLKERVKILGYVKNDVLPFFYNGAEIFVFPSLYEGFGLPLVEAMACGTPVICSNTSSFPEIGQEAVLYFNPYSIEELANQIEKLINDSELKQKLSKVGLERAKEFTWQKTAKQTLAVLHPAPIIKSNNDEHKTNSLSPHNLTIGAG